MAHGGGHEPNRLVAAVGSFVERAEGAEITPVLMQRERRRSVPCAELRVFLHYSEKAVAPGALLSGHLHGTQQIRWPEQLVVVQNNAVGRLRLHCRSADATCMQQLRIAEAAPGGEYLLAFLEKQPLFGKEGFVVAQIHHHVVGFDVAEVRLQRGGDLQIARWPPQQNNASFGLHAIAGETIVGGGNIGGNAVLLTRAHVVQAKRLKLRQKLRLRPRQRRPCVAFVGICDVALREDADGAGAVGFGHVHQRPRNEVLGAPALFGTRRGAAPSAVPRVAELAFRQNGAVGDAVAEIELKPESVAPFARGVEGDGEVVAVEVALIAPAQVLHQGFSFLHHVGAEVEAAFGIEHAHPRGQFAGHQRIGVDEAKVVVNRQALPRRFVQTPVDMNANLFVAPRQQDMIVGWKRQIGADARYDCGRLARTVG